MGNAVDTICMHKNFVHHIVEMLCMEDAVTRAGGPRALCMLLELGAAERTGLSHVELVRRVVLRRAGGDASWMIRTCVPLAP